MKFTNMFRLLKLKKKKIKHFNANINIIKGCKNLLINYRKKLNEKNTFNY